MATISQQEQELTESYKLADASKQTPVLVYTPTELPREQKIDKATLLKLIAAGFGFFISGVNDGSVGPLLPYMIQDYNINTAVVSIIYGANFLGWFLSALTNTHFRQCFDLGGLLGLGAFFQLVAHALRVWKPPFPFFVVTFWLACLGQAYQDAACNAYVASVKAAHRWLAFIHALYMAGCLVAPFVATPIASSNERSQWYLFYAFPVGIAALNLALTCFAFRDTIKLGRKRKSPAPISGTPFASDAEEEKESPSQLMIKALSTKALWSISLFFFFFLGATITASGWIVEYLVEIRNGHIGQMGYVPAGFNGGAMLGRLVLAEPTYRLGERRMVIVYVVLCIGFQLVFWLVPNIIAASVAISFLGFFSGPFFATGISVGSKLFPPNIQPTALSFIFVIGQIGGLLAGTGLSWLLVPKPKESTNTDLHQE